MKFRKIFGLTVCFVFIAVSFESPTFAQDRDRVVKTTSSRPINQPPSASTASSPISPVVKTLSSSRPVLTNEAVVQPAALVKKTGDSSPLNAMKAMVTKASNYGTATSGQMMGSIQSLLGIPYRYGSTGPNRFDCSGFVWTVFRDAGILFERSSAASYWQDFEPVTGDDRYKFGTLVFFNGLGHVGIVADSDGFYHASSSKGITYSRFEGYWEKRIVGFRRVPLMEIAAK